MCPDSVLAVSIETVSERESMLICVPSGAMNWFDWLSREARFLLVFFLIQFVAVVITFDEVPAAEGLGCWWVDG